MQPYKAKSLKKVLNISLIILAVLGLLVSLGFSVRETERITCTGIQVEVDHRQGNFFLTNEDVRRMVLSKGDSLVGRKLSRIPIASYERHLTAHPSVKKAEVFTRLNGTFSVKVQQREPILRVFNVHGESFYVDRDAQLMPTSDNYTARVPVATGFIHDRFSRMSGLCVAQLNDSVADRSVLDDLYRLSDFIMGDEFWRSQVQQIKVEHDGEFTLIPTVGDHHILLGKLDNMEQKFDKLLLFYRKALNTTGWDQYSHINLKYRNQVICTRR